MHLKRSSAILLHITSLPSPYGIGDLGGSAYKFVDFLNKSGHSYWQILPLNPTEASFGHSPYSSYSAFAGNPLLISPDLLVKEGLISKKSVSIPMGFDEGKVDFDKVSIFKEGLLDKAFENFKKKESLYQKAFSTFCEANKHWLEDFCLFITLKKKYNKSWFDWPEEVRDRQLATMETYRAALAEEIKRNNSYN
jgi:4-alpha-glucanotransferase